MLNHNLKPIVFIKTLNNIVNTLLLNNMKFIVSKVQRHLVLVGKDKYKYLNARFKLNQL